MGDYLAKPVELADLTAVIDRWARPDVRAQAFTGISRQLRKNGRSGGDHALEQ